MGGTEENLKKDKESAVYKHLNSSPICFVSDVDLCIWTLNVNFMKLQLQPWFWNLLANLNNFFNVASETERYKRGM